MAYDQSRGRVVLFGGKNTSALDDTWEWDGTDWIPKSVATKPSPTLTGADSAHPMAYDVQRGKTILHIGFTQTPQTWEWDGVNWRQVAIGTGPSRRWTGTMAYDAKRQVSVLFGGLYTSGNNPLINETWEWSGSFWSGTATPVSPPARVGHVMAWDPDQSVMVMFGGGDTVGASFPDLWHYDGTHWTGQIATGPTHSHASAMAYDPAAKAMVLFGGQDLSDSNPVTQLSNRTWQLKGGVFVRISTAQAPARRMRHRMVYDAARGVFVLFGGFNGSAMGDTWEFQPGIAGQHTPFGSGCPGSRGVPTLAVQGNSAVAGKAFSIQVDNMPLVGTAYMFMGVSNTLYGALPLPLSLSVIGAPGCTLYVSGDIVTPVQNVLGVGLWTVNIPIASMGATFFLQAIIIDPPATTLGLTTSNALTAIVGG